MEPEGWRRFLTVAPGTIVYPVTLNTDHPSWTGRLTIRVQSMTTNRLGVLLEVASPTGSPLPVRPSSRASLPDTPTIDTLMITQARRSPPTAG